MSTGKKFLKKLKRESRMDRASKFVESNIMYIVGLVFAVMLLSIVIVSINFYRKHRQTKLLQSYYSANMLISDGRFDSAIIVLEDVYGKSSNKLHSMAGMKLANLYRINGEPEKAIGTYGEIYRKEKDIFMRDLAGLSMLNIMINQADESSYDNIERLYQELKNSQNPLLPLVMEQYAMFEIQRGNISEAMEVLRNIMRLDNVDGETADRVDRLLSIYGGHA